MRAWVVVFSFLCWFKLKAHQTSIFCFHDLVGLVESHQAHWQSRSLHMGSKCMHSMQWLQYAGSEG